MKLKLRTGIFPLLQSCLLFLVACNWERPPKSFDELCKEYIEPIGLKSENVSTITSHMTVGGGVVVSDLKLSPAYLKELEERNFEFWTREGYADRQLQFRLKESEDLTKNLDLSSFTPVAQVDGMVGEENYEFYASSVENGEVRAILFIFVP